MSVWEYLEDYIIFLLSCILFLVAQSLILYFLGNNLSMIILLAIVWLMMFSIYLGIGYVRLNKRFQHMECISNQLDQKYLLYEVLPKGGSYEEQFYKHLLYCGNKSMIEEVSKIRRERLEYQEYIEQWVHEVKTPIAAMKLWSENQQVERKRDLQQQLERTESFVEQALYFARSEHVGKDLHIHRINICDCIHESITKNKYLCMKSNVKIVVINDPYYVYSDEKWMVFIMNQLIENAAKYRSEQQACISIHIFEHCEHVIVEVKDNGKGICAQDLPRVFEKGFTGENGRNANKHATGIGLYLCKRLCHALEIDIQIKSNVNSGTCVTLTFG